MPKWATASQKAFETTFAALSAAGQSSAQVELFCFGQEQGMLQTGSTTLGDSGRLLFGILLPSPTPPPPLLIKTAASCQCVFHELKDLNAP